MSNQPSKPKFSFTAFLEWAKPALVKFLKDKAIKTALKKLLGNAMAGGIKGWIVKYVVTELYDEVAKPIIQGAFEYLGYKYEVRNGEHVLRKIEDAENRDDWRDAVRDS